MALVLVLTNESSIEQLCWQALSRVGHEVVSAKTLTDAIRASLAVRVGAVIIDSSGVDDLEAASSWFRSSLGDGARIVFLASPKTRPASLPLDPENDQVVIKPCSADRVREAVESTLFGNGSPSEKVFAGGLELSRSSHTVRNEAGSVKLTQREFQIIEYLVANHDRFVPTAELAENIWHRPPNSKYSSIVSSSMKNLRAKIQQLASGKELIQTFPRRGYLLELGKTN